MKKNDSAGMHDSNKADDTIRNNSNKKEKFAK
jgi:hypothetical protein